MSEPEQQPALQMEPNLSFEAIALACSDINIPETEFQSVGAQDDWELNEEGEEGSIESASVIEADSEEDESIQSVVSFDANNDQLDAISEDSDLNSQPQHHENDEEAEQESVHPLDIYFEHSEDEEVVKSDSDDSSWQASSIDEKSVSVSSSSSVNASDDENGSDDDVSEGDKNEVDGEDGENEGDESWDAQSDVMDEPVVREKTSKTRTRIKAVKKSKSSSGIVSGRTAKRVRRNTTTTSVRGGGVDRDGDSGASEASWLETSESAETWDESGAGSEQDGNSEMDITHRARKRESRKRSSRTNARLSQATRNSHTDTNTTTPTRTAPTRATRSNSYVQSTTSARPRTRTPTHATSTHINTTSSDVLSTVLPHKRRRFTPPRYSPSTVPTITTHSVYNTRNSSMIHSAGMPSVTRNTRTGTGSTRNTRRSISANISNYGDGGDSDSSVSWLQGSDVIPSESESSSASGGSGVRITVAKSNSITRIRGSKSGGDSIITGWATTGSGTSCGTSSSTKRTSVVAGEGSGDSSAESTVVIRPRSNRSKNRHSSEHYTRHSTGSSTNIYDQSATPSRTTRSTTNYTPPTPHTTNTTHYHKRQRIAVARYEPELIPIYNTSKPKHATITTHITVEPTPENSNVWCHSLLQGAVFVHNNEPVTTAIPDVIDLSGDDVEHLVEGGNVNMNNNNAGDYTSDGNTSVYPTNTTTTSTCDTTTTGTTTSTTDVAIHNHPSPSFRNTTAFENHYINQYIHSLLSYMHNQENLSVLFLQFGIELGYDLKYFETRWQHTGVANSAAYTLEYTPLPLTPTQDLLLTTTVQDWGGKGYGLWDSLAEQFRCTTSDVMRRWSSVMGSELQEKMCKLCYQKENSRLRYALRKVGMGKSDVHKKYTPLQIKTIMQCVKLWNKTPQWTDTTSFWQTVSDGTQIAKSLLPHVWVNICTLHPYDKLFTPWIESAVIRNSCNDNWLIADVYTSVMRWGKVYWGVLCGDNDTESIVKTRWLHFIRYKLVRLYKFVSGRGVQSITESSVSEHNSASTTTYNNVSNPTTSTDTDTTYNEVSLCMNNMLTTLQMSHAADPDTHSGDRGSVYVDSVVSSVVHNMLQSVTQPDNVYVPLVVTSGVKLVKRKFALPPPLPAQLSVPPAHVTIQSVPLPQQLPVSQTLPTPLTTLPKPSPIPLLLALQARVSDGASLYNKQVQQGLISAPTTDTVPLCEVKVESSMALKSICFNDSDTGNTTSTTTTTNGETSTTTSHNTINTTDVYIKAEPTAGVRKRKNKYTPGDTNSTDDTDHSNAAASTLDVSYGEENYW